MQSRGNVSLGMKDVISMVYPQTQTTPNLDTSGLKKLTQKTPATSQKFKISGDQASAVGNGALQITQNLLNQNAAVKSVDSLLADAGMSNASTMGVGYQMQNDINATAEISGLNSQGLSNTLSSVGAGVTAGAAFGPIGAGIGAVVGGVAGLIGWGSSKRKLRKRIENAQNLAVRRNVQNSSSAMSQGLTNKYYSENGNSTDGLLFANGGKDRYKIYKRYAK